MSAPKGRKALPRKESTELHDLELVIRAEELQVRASLAAIVCLV
jgi:hypothetical protein